MTNTNLAKALGVSPAQITRWRARGMPGDLASALEWHAAHIRTRRRRNGAGVPAASTSATADGLPIRSWRERADRAAARLRELQLAQAEGRLIDAAEARAQGFRAGRTIRDAVLSVPPRICNDIVALGPDAGAVERFLLEALRQALTRLGELIDGDA